MEKQLFAAVVGGLLGYIVLYKIIGCSSGACRITANPYISTLYGIVLGVLLVGGPSLPPKSAGSGESNQPTIEYQRITAQEAKARMDSGDSIVILDVRTEAEYAAGHIANAVLIPNETITDSQPELLPELDAEILVYCRSGNRSAQAARKLIAIGYTKVYDFGGIIDWPYDVVTD